MQSFLMLPLWHQKSFILNMQSDAQNTKIYVIMTALMQPLLKFWSDTQHIQAFNSSAKWLNSVVHVISTGI
jgi:hypothetical protein